MCEFGDHRCKGLDLAPQPSIVGSQFPVVITGLCKLSLHGPDIRGDGSTPDRRLELVEQIAVMFVESLAWYARFGGQRYDSVCAVAPLGVVVS